MDETTDKEKAGNSPACPDFNSLIFRLTIYIAQKLSNLTVCFEQEADICLSWYIPLCGYYPESIIHLSWITYKT
ncbi:TPA: hypothetical protein ACHF8U_004469, partial [Escherichia coli]